MSDDVAIARHIDRLTRLFTEQVQQAGGWPAAFTFPEPASDTEREALRQFIDEVEQTTGAEVRFAHRGPNTEQ